MPNFPLLAAGQQAATTVATALPQTVPPNPYPGGGQVRGEGIQVTLGCTKASTQPLYYGGNNNVGASGNNAGKELQPGTEDVLRVSDTSQIFIVAAGNGTSTATWSACNI